MVDDDKGVILKNDYYLDNFRYLLDFILKVYSDLLSKEEIHFIKNFNALGSDSQMLYVRLVSRKGPWFILEKIRYEEIKSIQQATDELEENMFLLKNSGIELSEALTVLTKVEIVDLLKSTCPDLNINYTYRYISYNKSTIRFCICTHIRTN